MGRKLINSNHPLQSWIDNHRVDKSLFIQKLGVSLSYLNMIIAGVRMPSVDVCLKIKVETNREITPEVLKDEYDKVNQAA